MRSDVQKVVRFGLMTLLLSLLPSVFFLIAVPEVPRLGTPAPKVIETPTPTPSLQLPLLSDAPTLPIGNGRAELSFSVDPPRPDSNEVASRLLIRLTQSKQIKRVELPARVDLEYREGRLRFSEKHSPFWLLCSPVSESEILASLFYQTPEGEAVLNAEWSALLQETPMQSVEEFPVATPFRELGEARWLGADLFLEKYGESASSHRLEIGPAAKYELVACSYKDWLVFKAGKWAKIADLSEAENLPIAHLKAATPGGLEIEGWEGSSHIRMKIAAPILPPLKMKGEELFTQLRVRSDKQVSCMLDKQCLILRPNDWIVKTQGRWKILRKTEERNAFLDGKLSGEIFVLDRIEAKGATKNIGGHYFSSTRSQMVPIDYAQKPSSQKGALKK